MDQLRNRYFVSVVAGIAGILLYSAIGAQTDESPKKLFQEAVGLQKDKDYQGAWEKLDRILHGDSDAEVKVAATLQLGKLYKEMRKPRAAIISYRNAYNFVALNPVQQSEINDETLKLLSLYMVDRPDEMKSMLIELAKLRHQTSIFPVSVEDLVTDPWFSNSIGVTGLTIMRHESYSGEDKEFTGILKSKGEKTTQVKIFDNDFPGVEDLLRGIRARDPWVRQTCLFFLGKTAKPESEERIIDSISGLLKTPPDYWNKDDIRQAQLALLRIGDTALGYIKRMKVASDDLGQLSPVHVLLAEKPFSETEGMIQGQVLCYSRQLGLLNSQVMAKEIELDLFESARGPRNTPMEPMQKIKTDDHGKFSVKVKPGFYRVSLQNSPEAYGEEIKNVEVVAGKYTVVLPASYFCETPKTHQP